MCKSCLVWYHWNLGAALFHNLRGPEAPIGMVRVWGFRGLPICSEELHGMSCCLIRWSIASDDPIDPKVRQGSSSGNKKRSRFAKDGTQRPMNTPKVYSKCNPKNDSNNFKHISTMSTRRSSKDRIRIFQVFSALLIWEGWSHWGSKWLVFQPIQTADSRDHHPKWG